MLAVAGDRKPYWVCAFYLVALAVAGLAAALFMDDVEQRIEVGHFRSILTMSHTWIVTVLYIGAFGSFIGLAFAFGRVLYEAYVGAGQSPAAATLHVAAVEFIGPLLGAIGRVVGGKLSDRFGGSRVTLGVFAGMIPATALLVAVSAHAGGGLTGAATAGYLAGFIVLFICSGVGSGSVYKMIPSIFAAASRSLPGSEDDRRHWAQAHSGALLGLAGAAGALGGVGINLVLRQSYDSTGAPTAAFWFFLAYYTVAALLTWTHYVRPPRLATPVGAGEVDHSHI